MINLAVIRDHVVSMLDKELPSILSYHNVDHTLDVTSQCLAIAKEEGIEDEHLLMTLQVAALYHDTGFIHIYHGHEKKGCEIAREQLPLFNINEQVIVDVCGLIMATKVPQLPNTYLQSIICDADLDYLGREDFFERGDNLRRELLEYKLINSNHDWEERQLDFLQSHSYFTKTSFKKRNPVKMKFINQLMQNRREQMR